jgi:hypothetical protein
MRQQSVPVLLGATPSRRQRRNLEGAGQPLPRSLKGLAQGVGVRLAFQSGEEEKGFIFDGWMEGDRSLSIKIYGARIADLEQPSSLIGLGQRGEG